MITTVLSSIVLAASLKVGDTAPDFTVADTDGQPRNLSTLVEKGPVVLAFFPKAFTRGCTRELEAYRDRMAELDKSGGQVIAVSTDDLETQRKFKADLGARYAFVADAKAELATLYGVKAPDEAWVKRRTFVIGKGRRILAIQDGEDAIDPTGAIAACSAK